MPRSICSPVALLALVVAVSAGCTAAPAAPPDPFPPRPADIDIERVDPCAMLGPELQRELQVGQGQAGTAPVRGVTTRACGWLSMRTGYDYSVQLIPQDAAEAVGTPGAVVGAVEGYGTVQITDRVETFPLCEILVDVNEGQLVRIQVQTLRRQSDGSAYPVEDACGFSNRVAVDAVRMARDQVS